ncbi:LVIVD repeat-containing protein [Beijerinckia sp. L45]|uniref:LVIVD repeat-containing protein n=1 Tax=Beijerinckia sp. L45 TaxID=1641855 RepID=UPI001FF0351A|nr:RNA polymerase subunit sigma-70 [Beijerinckia sp. L45]
MRDGIAFIGHIAPPYGTSIVDVRDPKNPKILSQIMLPDMYSHSHKVRVTGDLMIVNSEMYNRHYLRKGLEMAQTIATLEAALGRGPTDAELAATLSVTEAELPGLRAVGQRGYQDGGFRIFDISDLTKPREIAFQKTGGIGVHRFDCDDSYAYISSEMPGFQGNILVNYDIRDPTRIENVSKWWIPGQNIAAGETPTWNGVRKRLHHGLRSGNEIWAACWYGGAYAIDVSDIRAPKTIAHHDYHPPFPEPTHTIMRVPHAIAGRQIALCVDEEHPHDVSQPHAFLWILDVSDYKNIKPISTFHVVNPDLPWARAHLEPDGSYGHDVYGPGSHQFQERLRRDNILYCTWFTAGLRVIDLNDPTKPKEIGHYVPEPAKGYRAPQSNDVDVDDAGLIYLLDRDNGFDILEMTV